jgi:hypothetical protein
VIDKNAIFLGSLKKCGLPDGPGVISLISLKHAFICMRLRLEEQRTTVSDERKILVAAIHAAVDDETSKQELTDAERKAAHDTLDSAFDDMVRRPAVSSIKANFLSRVKF